MQLRDFSCRNGGCPVLICAPYAIHGALIADFAPGHSIVEALQRVGLDRLYLTDWRSASADMRFFSIDSYLSDLNIAVDDIGAPIDLIGLCQGGWLSLIYAARFPDKVRRLVLVGTPVDTSIPSELSSRVANAPQATFEAFVNSGAGLVRGHHLLRFWHTPPHPQVALQKSLSDDGHGKELLDRFNRWHDATLDLPGRYYLQVVDWIFRQNRLANGSFVALGREVQLDRLTIPVFLLVGAEDEVVPAEQARATAPLLGRASIETIAAPCSHLGLFMGYETLATSWLRIAKWLRGGEAAQRSPEAASG
jgi:poly(3-hydroxyalkanoate) synthetase